MRLQRLGRQFRPLLWLQLRVVRMEYLVRCLLLILAAVLCLVSRLCQMVGNHMVNIVMVNTVVLQTEVIITIRHRVGYLSEVASLSPVEDRMVKGLLREDKVAKIPLMVVRMVKGRLHLLLTRVVCP